MLDSAAKVAAFTAANPDIQLLDVVRNGGGDIVSARVKGIDRVDLWVGGLAEKHINGGMVGQTFWVVLHEQFDRLQQGDRFYYKDRLEAFDFYDEFIDGQNFADIVARNTGLDNLPEHIFLTDDEDDDDQDDDDDNNNDDDDDVPGDDEDEDDDDEQNTDNEGSGDDDDDGTGNTPLPVAAKTLIGTGDSDILTGDEGDDVLLGGGGPDILAGNGGADILRGEAGQDVLLGGGGMDVMHGGGGDDQMHGGAGNDMIFGGGGVDLIFGDDGDDVIEGGYGRDTVYAGAGNDRVIASMGEGYNSYNGDEGIDTLDYSASQANLKVDLGNGFMGRGYVQSSTDGTDTITGFENFIGGIGHDTIRASNAVNVIDGGAGNDVFQFGSAAQANGDTIYGFQTGDKIDFTGMNETGMRLVAGTTLNDIGDVSITHETRDGEEFTIIRGNTQGDDAADFELALHGRHNLTVNDFNSVS